MSDVPEFYKLDSTHVTMREYAYDSRNPLTLLIALILRTLRVSIPGSTDDVPVPQLTPFRVALLPEDLQERVLGPVAEFLQLGFADPVYYVLEDKLNRTTTALVAFRHATGAIGRVHLRLRKHFTPPKPKLFAEILTPCSDGTFVWTISGKPDMLAPAGCDVQRLEKADVPALWAAHQQHLASAARTPAAVRDEAGLTAALDKHQALLWEFHRGRGVFRPAKPAEMQAVPQTVTAAAPDGTVRRHQAVLEQIDAIQNKKGTWAGAFWLLLFSIALFIALGKGDWPVKDFLCLIPILLFHEAGHYVAMRAFGYRNLKMFFIPFLGAAVTGRHYNVSGWKKVIVSLAGPLPGIFVGIILGVVGMVMGNTEVIHIALLAVIINGFNLLPLMPLDGGHVMHALLFSRHYLLDVGFRIVAAVTLLLASIVAGKACMYLGILMLLGTPLAYRLARITGELRSAGVQGNSTDGHSIPPDLAKTIVDKLVASSSKTVSTKILAQQTLSVFESLNARPPGPLPTLGLMVVHGGTFFAVLVACVVMVVAEGPGFRGLMNQMTRRPTHVLTADAVATWNGPAYVEPVAERRTIVATFGGRSAAQRTADRVRGELPAAGGLMLFGDSVFVTLPGAQAAKRDALFKELEGQAEGVYVEGADQMSHIRFQGLAPTEAAAAALHAELSEYLRLAYAHQDLVAPWHVGTAVTEADYARYRQARRTLQRITESQFNTYSDPEMRALATRAAEARRRGDATEVKALAAKREALEREVSQRHLDELAKLGPDEIDQDFLKEWRSRPTTSPLLFDQKLPASLAARLGVVGGQASLTPTAVSGGWATHDGTSVEVNLMAPDIAHLAPAVREWLMAQGVRSLRYDITEPLSGPDDWE